MKHIFNTLAVIISIVLLSVSCTGPQGPQGPQGRDGRDGRDGVSGANLSYMDLFVAAEDWAYSNESDNNYFIATFDAPYLTQDMYDNAQISVYREYYGGTADAAQRPLPYSSHMEYLDGKDLLFYTETVDFEFGIGFINIVYTLSDFSYEIDDQMAPKDMNFRVVFLR